MSALFGPNTCQTCGRAAGAPFRIYDERGKIVNGCVDAFHSGHLVTPSESARWHYSPGAKKIRAARAKFLKTGSSARNPGKGVRIAKYKVAYFPTRNADDSLSGTPHYLWHHAVDVIKSKGKRALVLALAPNTRQPLFAWVYKDELGYDDSYVSGVRGEQRWNPRRKRRKARRTSGRRRKTVKRRHFHRRNPVKRLKMFRDL